MFIVVGLGNPGGEYENTRHNTGAMVLEAFRKMHDLPEWKEDVKRKAFISEGEVEPLDKKKAKPNPKDSVARSAGGGFRGKKGKVMLVFPQTFMNKSGESLKNLQLTTHNLQQGKKKTKEVTNLAVIHDDLDIPFGSFKISFNKSSGGHHGVESIMKAVKTEAFVRVRIGIAASASVVEKSQDDKTVEKIILGKFTPDQMSTLKKMGKHIAEGLTVLITENRDKAMSQYHS